MVIVEMSGGLGNQLYKYAFSRSLALQLNTELKFDLSLQKKRTYLHHDWYKLDAFNIPQNFATPEEVAQINPDEWKIMDEKFLPVQQGDNVCIKGFWFQNEKFFKDIEDIVRREVTLKNPLSPNSAAWKEKILNSACAVSLHVRLGDYLLPSTRNTFWGKVLPFDYYDTAINELKKTFSDLKIFVFSDDLQWCKENLKFDVPTEFVEGCEHDFEEMYLMSICHHNIIPNSTFAWWGAWLNQNSDKKIFNSASYRELQKNSSPNKRALIEFPPMLSIIVYVGNNLPTIDLSLTSIFSQDFLDYEVILIDASTDGSEEICREFATNKNVTLLTVERSTTKFSAWNKALDVAHGEYILFLTAKDFMSSNVTQDLADFYYSYLEEYVVPMENYISCANYNQIFPNIICSTQLLNEDEQGIFDIGLPTKKFSVAFDKLFKNQNILVETTFSANEKLLALGGNGINNFVGTKFFKRKFLDENKIRYLEGGGMDAELIFISESFLKTEKIVFMPKIIIGRLK